MMAMMLAAIITCMIDLAAEVTANTKQAPSSSPTNIQIAIANHPHRVSNMLVLIVVKCQEMCTVWITLLAENKVSTCNLGGK